MLLELIAYTTILFVPQKISINLVTVVHLRYVTAQVQPK